MSTLFTMTKKLTLILIIFQLSFPVYASTNDSSQQFHIGNELSQEVEAHASAEMHFYATIPRRSLDETLQQERILGQRLLTAILKIQNIRRQPHVSETDLHHMKTFLAEARTLINTAVVMAYKVSVPSASATPDEVKQSHVGGVLSLVSALTLLTVGYKMPPGYMDQSGTVGPLIISGIITSLIFGSAFTISALVDGNKRTLSVPPAVRSLLTQLKQLSRKLKKSSYFKKAMKEFLKPIQQANMTLKQDSLPSTSTLRNPQSYLKKLYSELNSQCAALLSDPNERAEAEIQLITEALSILDHQQVRAIDRTLQSRSD